MICFFVCLFWWVQQVCYYMTVVKSSGIRWPQQINPYKNSMSSSIISNAGKSLLRQSMNKCKVFTLAFQMFDNEQPQGHAFALTISSGACHRWGMDRVWHWSWGWLLTFRKCHSTSCCSFVLVVDTTGFLYFCNRKSGGFEVRLKCFYSFVSWWTLAVVCKIALYKTNYKNTYNYRIYRHV